MPSTPHGGRLVSIDRRSSDKTLTKDGSVVLHADSVTTLMNLADGVYSPLEGFMTKDDCESVLDRMRLADGTPWTMPILLHVPESLAAGAGDDLDLLDDSGNRVGVLAYEETYDVEPRKFAERAFGTSDASHPGVAHLYEKSRRVVGGKLRWIATSPETPFSGLALTPRETRALFGEKGWKSVAAFQTRNAPHIGHEYVQKTALEFVDGIFINPVLGKKKSGDFTDEAIVAAYKVLMKGYYPPNSAVMSVLNYEMQYAGPREAIMHAIMRKNFGCTHIAIGRDHAGVGNFYGPYAAQEIFKDFPDLGITPLFFREFYYCKKCMGIANERICPHLESERLTFSGTKLREMFQSGVAPPQEFMRPEVASAILGMKSPFVE